ncbi:uncharacterized protein FOMMEDRAFT_22829 [Fomitiporia mediterranea MF3/22]|uniref:uncharacterized protein n=1 Tax=Fomitiporia mediterranea (strain MF3/22) TaxID=694068 RepID=UPI0004408712|nr:uncharacterized protein FOMMEDRAFT_22829 [Fomitiporia mediterranea MF3/22]EJC99735.1 hypothetical protein FOMMEDRAFT_22829 [Fomitiporia mediterranea MF3/22]
MDLDNGFEGVLRHSARVSQETSLASVAIYTVFVYNFVMTMPDEVEFVWSCRFHIGSAIYFLTRYIAALSLSIDTIHVIMRVVRFGGHQVSIFIDKLGYLDYNYMWFPSGVSYIIGIIGLITSMVLIQLRTSALYGNSRKLIIFFVVLDLVLISAVVVLQLYRVLSFTPFIWIPLAFTELVSLLITVLKTYRNYRSFHGDKIKFPSFLWVALRDNTIYLVVILLFYFIGTVLIFVTEDLENPHFQASVAISGIIAPWMYINLRKAQILNPCTEPSIPTMQFNIPLENRSSENDVDAAERSI